MKLHGIKFLNPFPFQSVLFDAELSSLHKGQSVWSYTVQQHTNEAANNPPRLLLNAVLFTNFTIKVRGSFMVSNWTRHIG